MAFCRDVIAGLPPGPLPDDPEEREQLLILLEVHRLSGLWLDSPDSHGEAEAQEVATRTMLQALKGRLIMEAAERAEATLREAGFQTLLFKGAGLIRSGIYPDGRSRSVGDADLLVRGGDPGRAVAALQEADFEPWVPWQPGRDAWLPASALTDTSAPPELQIDIDLHWRIPYGSFRSGEGDRDQDVLWEGADAESGLPSPEVHALLLAEHFVRHLRVVPHLIGVADLARILPRIRSPERLRTLAEQRASLRLLRAVLWFLRAEIEVPLPPGLDEAVEIPRRLRSATASGLRLDQLLASGGRRFQGRVRGLLSQAWLQSSASDLLREVGRVVLPPGDWLAWRAGADTRGALRNRVDYWRDLLLWASGRAPSPLSPNQEFEGPTGRH